MFSITEVMYLYLNISVQSEIKIAALLETGSANLNDKSGQTHIENVEISNF